VTAPSTTKEDALDDISDSADAVLDALDGADMGIFVLDQEFTVRWMNRTMGEYFGLDRQAVLGRDKATLIESQIRSIFAEPERFTDSVRSTYEDNTYIEEFECHVLAGEHREERWLRHQSRPIRRGDLAGGRVEHYTDITAQKARERELERQNGRLEKFASVVSHDLRNPLLVAEGRLELAEADGASDNVADAKAAIERSQALVDDLLTLSRQGDVVGSPEDVDLAALVESCWATVDTGDASLTVDTSVRVRADRSRLQQAVQNLLANASEHGGPDPEITVGAVADGFFVADDGPGVSAAVRETAFEPGVTTTDGGTGFGLAIVAEIVAAHGWTVRLAESEHGGARVEITGLDTVDDAESAD